MVSGKKFEVFCDEIMALVNGQVALLVEPLDLELCEIFTVRVSGKYAGDAADKISLVFNKKAANIADVKLLVVVLEFLVNFWFWSSYFVRLHV